MRHIRTRRMSKEKNQRYHSKIRALQHFGQQLTNDDLAKMVEIYRHSSDTRILRKQSLRVSKAIITYNGTVYPIVYDKQRHQIVTILKPEYLTPSDRDVYDACVAKLFSTTGDVGHTVLPDNLTVNTVDEEPEEDPVIEEPKQVLSEHVLITDEDEDLMKEFFDRLNF